MHLPSKLLSNYVGDHFGRGGNQRITHVNAFCPTLALASSHHGPLFGAQQQNGYIQSYLGKDAEKAHSHRFLTKVVPCADS